ncbi:hypothetical protein DdX_18614 [Ditylenchus destructor]|uniref:Uncharacterized protein n=1 Tax=Ditylenchus destructor TaxID=166010 RepID=A0AAD4QXZ7_9BILA|nr:hypothetical protein DdX_18614 [Ditylenchus destructor]
MRLSTLLFVQVSVSYFFSIPTAVSDSNKMASIDAFAQEFSIILNSTDNGTTKYKKLSKGYVSLMEIADSVAAKITEVLKGTDKQELVELLNAVDNKDLSIVWYKLLPIYLKLKHYYGSQPSMQTPLPTMYLAKYEKERNLAAKSNWDFYVSASLYTVHINIEAVLNEAVLDGDETKLHSVSCDGNPFSLHEAVVGFRNYSRDYAKAYIQEYGLSVVDYLYATFHDIILRMIFYAPFCDAKARTSDAPFSRNREYKKYITEYFERLDSDIKMLLDETTLTPTDMPLMPTTTHTILTDEIGSGTTKKSDETLIAE